VDAAPVLSTLAASASSHLIRPEVNGVDDLVAAAAEGSAASVEGLAAWSRARMVDRTSRTAVREAESA